jgi:hypothetical protein
MMFLSWSLSLYRLPRAARRWMTRSRHLPK